MSVVAKVGPIPSTGGWWPHASDRTDPMMKVATTCHFATVYWLFEEAYDQPITFDQYLDFGNPETFVANLLSQGTLLQQSHKIYKEAGLKAKKNGSLVAAGSVIVFAPSKTSAGHSCIALSSQTIGGYNQTDWFSSPGREHEYTTHDTVDIKWKTKHAATRGEAQYSLFAIDESTAIAALKARVSNA